MELKIARVVKDLQAETRAQAQALADEIAAARKCHEDAARARAEKSAARYEAIVADADAALARIKAETKRRIRAFEEAREEDDRARAELAAAVARSEEGIGRKAGAVKDSVARKSARAAAKVSELQEAGQRAGSEGHAHDPRAAAGTERVSGIRRREQPRGIDARGERSERQTDKRTRAHAHTRTSPTTFVTRA